MTNGGGIATIDPGRPNLLMDHLQLGLRRSAPTGADAGEPAPDPHFYLSLYVIPWSREMGSGHVALIRYRGDGGLAADMTLTDNPSLAAAQLGVLRSVGYSRVDLSAAPGPASFVRNPLVERDNVRYLITAADLEIEARWDDLGEAIFAYGPAPQQPERQRIWSMLFEAGTGSAWVNGGEVPGQTYAMENWISWLGRPLHSAHVARGEILVDDPASPG
jgi:hypothetical protein